MTRYLVVALLLAGCTGTAAPGQPSLTSSPGSAPESPPERMFVTPRAEFPVAQIEVGGRPWTVALADTAERRRAGLMRVTELGELDGMLFLFPEPTSGTFWMKDTLIPLDIAFFQEDGELVAVLEMEPCRADPCPGYGPGAPYRFALEAPAGELAGLPPDTRLTMSQG